MSKIGEKIKELRKKKGLSQESLAELARVNLRTIQRIEKNESEPRGNTLNLICVALDISAEDIIDYGKKIDNDYLILFHLSVLSFLAIPIGNIIIPLSLWLTKKEKVIGLKEVGTNLLNFQIVWSILSFLSITIFALTKILHYGNFKIFLYIFILLYIINIVLPILFAIGLKRGNPKYKYPSLMNLIK